MERKALFFDVDGTLIPVGEKQEVPAGTLAAIKKAREKGHIVFVNTGRVFGIITPAVMEMEKDGIVCGCGTCIVIDGKIEMHRSIPLEKCREAADMARKCRVYATYEAFDGAYFDDLGVETAQHRLFRSWLRLVGKPTDKTSKDPDFNFDKIFAWSSPESDMKSFTDFLSRDFDIIDRGDGDVEAVPKGYSKATGMAEVLKRYGIPVERSYAFGDSNNDLAMLQFTPNSVVMGGSNPELCRIASFVTKPVEQDGIAYAMEKLGII